MSSKEFAFLAFVIWSGFVRGDTGSSAKVQDWSPLTSARQVSAQLSSIASNLCDRPRQHTDAIVILGQKKHSSYDASRDSSFHPVLLSLEANYKATSRADVMIWHEGDLNTTDLPPRLSYNVSFCNLKLTSAWGLPEGITSDFHAGVFSIGYRLMIRFFAITAWRLMQDMGYRWLLRLDDDSKILSPIRYNLFDRMRRENRTYGFRSLAQECGLTPRVHVMIDKFAADNGLRMPGGTWCRSAGAYGFYNNFFITDLAWWNTPKVAGFLLTVDQSMLIFTHREGDIVWQTAAVRLLLPPSQRLHFIDFTYLHATVRNSIVDYGGMDVGTEDPEADAHIDSYLHKSRFLVKRKHVLDCEVWDAACPGQNRSAGGGACRTRYIPAGILNPQRTKFIIHAPACIDPSLSDPFPASTANDPSSLHEKIFFFSINTSTTTAAAAIPPPAPEPLLMHHKVLYRIPLPVPFYLSTFPVMRINSIIGEAEVRSHFLSPKPLTNVTLGNAVRERDTRVVFFVTNSSLERIASGQQLTEKGMSFDDVKQVEPVVMDLISGYYKLINPA